MTAKNLLPLVGLGVLLAGCGAVQTTAPAPITTPPTVTVTTTATPPTKTVTVAPKLSPKPSVKASPKPSPKPSPAPTSSVTHQAMLIQWGYAQFQLPTADLGLSGEKIKEIAVVDAGTGQVYPRASGFYNPVTLDTIPLNGNVPGNTGWSTSGDGQTWLFSYPLAYTGTRVMIQITLTNGHIIDSESFILYASAPTKTTD